jgi:hypothetical protein
LIHVLLTGRHDYTIAKYLASGGQALSDRLRASAWRDVLRRRALPGGTYILSDFDRLRSRSLRRVERIADVLQASDAVRLLNHPARVLGRVALLQRLHADGTNPYAVHRPDALPADVRFPVFLRMASDHQGPRSPLLHDRAQVQQAARRLARRGKRRHDMIVVEFQETVDRRGQYRKYGAFRVGDRIVPRHLFFGRQWDRKTPANCEDVQFDEEEAYVRDNPHEGALRAIFDLAGIEYGRIDYALVEDRPCVWEINTNPMISIPEDMTTGRPGVIHALFHERFREALAAIDTQGSGEIDLRGTRPGLLQRLRRRGG